MKDKTGAIIIEGHIQGLSNVRSLGETGIPVYVVDKTKCVAQYSRYCRKFFLCPDFILDEFASFLINLAINESIRGWVLMPSNDHAVYTISKHKNTLEKYFSVITPGVEIIDTIYDKVKLLGIAANLRIPFPRTCNFETSNEPVPDNLTFPVLTKGRNGLSFYRTFKKKVFLARTEDELRSQLKEISKQYNLQHTFTQELIHYEEDNKTISFSAFCINGEIKCFWMGMKLREHPLQFGTGTFAKSIYVKKCYDNSVVLLSGLQYTGVCEIEYLFDPQDCTYKLIEINPRTWLWVGLAKACGVDYAKIIYYYSINTHYDYPTVYQKDMYWINPISDTFFSILAIMRGKLRLVKYINSILKTSKVNALVYHKDNRPFFAYLMNLYRFTYQR